MSSDVLTQLQTCYDQLLTQFFSSVSYLSLRHPLIAPDPIPGEPHTQVPKDDKMPEGTSTKHRYTKMAVSTEDTAMGFQAVPPATFQHAQDELAEDLIMKGQQIEQLIRSLPGLGRGEEQQAREIQELAIKVREMEKLRKQKRKELRQAVRQLDDIILGMATSINTDAERPLPMRNGATHGT
jgi:mediator of RNA polymerase II transcription subunit 21